MDSENKCTQIQLIFQNMFKTIFKDQIFNKDIKIKKLETGLSNYLYKIEANGNKYFLKIFGQISIHNLVNRNFETDLIDCNSKYKICGNYIFTDFTTFRVEEFLENLKKPNDECLLSDELFINKMLNCLLIFQYSIEEFPYDSQTKYKSDKNLYVKSFLNNIIKVAKNNLEYFEKEHVDWKNINKDVANLYTKTAFFETYIKKVNLFLNNYETIYGELLLGLEDIPLFLNHNDVHKHNLLLKSTSEKDSSNYDLLLIDYEYACFNYIGFDIINYCIESFFDLEYPEYPFYSKLVENVEVLLSEKKYYEIYDKYLVLFLEKLKKIKSEDYCENFLNKIYPILVTEKYFLKVSGLCSLFWFYCSLISLNFSKIINEDSFDYMNYSLERLKIYEYAKRRLDN
jgi:thiamine kinase-like enzyme